MCDAEDALQNGLVRAWRGLQKFEGRASLRTWLYRVATNACLDLIADRRGRTMPYTVTPPGAIDDHPGLELEPRWLEPFPDAMLDDGPDAMYTRRESIRLAFVIALNALPARQRAVLLLREVVAMSAEETAEILGITVVASNSLLQRARETLAALPRLRAADPAPAVVADVLAKYLHAWESGDANALIAILRRDAISSMPPNPLWLSGADVVGAYVAKYVFAGGPIRLVPYAANGAPAFAVYQRRGAAFSLQALTVLELDGDRVAAFHSFLTLDPKLSAARYGLASEVETIPRIA